MIYPLESQDTYTLEDPSKYTYLISFFLNETHGRLGNGLLNVLEPFQEKPLVRVPLESTNVWANQIQELRLRDWRSFEQRDEVSKKLLEALLEYANKYPINRWQRVVIYMTFAAFADSLGGVVDHRLFVESFKDPQIPADINSRNYANYIKKLLVVLYENEARTEQAGPLGFQCLTHEVLFSEEGLRFERGQDNELIDYLNLRDKYVNGEQVKDMARKNKCYDLIINQDLGTYGADIEPNPTLSFSERLKYFVGGDKRKVTVAGWFRIVLIIGCIICAYFLINRPVDDSDTGGKNPGVSSELTENEEKIGAVSGESSVAAVSVPVPVPVSAPVARPIIQTQRTIVTPIVSQVPNPILAPPAPEPITYLPEIGD